MIFFKLRLVKRVLLGIFLNYSDKIWGVVFLFKFLLILKLILVFFNLFISWCFRVMQVVWCLVIFFWCSLIVWVKLVIVGMFLVLVWCFNFWLLLCIKDGKMILWCWYKKLIIFGLLSLWLDIDIKLIWFVWMFNGKVLYV